jgi:hypothetical protein
MNLTHVQDRRAMLNQRSEIIRNGLEWPLDKTEKERAPKPEKVAESKVDYEQIKREVEFTPVTPVAPVAEPKQLETTSDEVLQEWVDIGPELALELLKSNPKDNRNLRTEQVEKLSRDMAAGRWRVTGESIKFDTAGMLMDGQHRLNAVVRSGATIHTLMVVGLKPEAREVIDTQSTRTGRDALTFHGGHRKNSATIVAAARIAILRESGLWTKANDTTTPLITNSEIVEWIDDNDEAVTKAASLAMSTYRAINARPGTWAYAMLKLNEIDPVAASEFATSLSTYSTDGPGDPRLALLSMFAKMTRDRSRMRQPEQLFYIFKAWNAWRKGRKVTRLMTTITAPDVIIPTPI